MEIDMLDPPLESNDSIKETSNWSSYLNEFATTKKNEEFLHKVGNSRPIYLFRNKRRNPYWKDFKKQHNLLKNEKDEEDEDDDDKDGEDEDRKGKANKEKKGGEKHEKKYATNEEESHKGKSEVAQDSETEKEKSPSETRMHKSFEGANPDRSGVAATANITDDYDDENIDDAAALARSNRTPLGGDDDDDDDDKRGGADSDGGLGDDEDDEKGAESTSKRRKIRSSPDGLARRVHSIDTIIVKFQHKSYYHMFVKNTGMFMYHHQRLARTKACHKKVTQKKFKHMTNWTKTWLAHHVTAGQSEDCRRWLMGLATESRSNSTSATEMQQYDRTPYRAFTRYTVDWVAPSSGRHSPTSASN